MEIKPLVSICMITYNQEAFISQAIEGILMQQTKFPFELIIGEDFSTDSTREVCFKYQQNHPKIIQVVLRNKNLGMMQNFIDTLEHCSGKYIALCEGDDFWIDPLKLQKQIDFLETNPDFSICFHRVKVLHEDVDKKPLFSNPNQKTITTFEDLAVANFIQTASVVYRNKLFDHFPENFLELSAGDYPLHLLNAQYGKIMFFEDLMSVYRIHNNGEWNRLEAEKQNKNWLQVLETCYHYFYPNGAKNFEKQISQVLSQICFINFDKNKYEEYRYYFFRLVKRKKMLNLRTMIPLTIRFFLSFQKDLAKTYKKLFSNE
jgi:glycosyltransferase involved in cell wall biosynthesis